MDWVWDNLQLILIIAGGIAMWLNQMRREKNGEPADYDGDGVPDNRTPPRSRSETRELSPESRDGSNPEQDDRVRQIQEEIRRKIAERRGQAAPPPMPAPVPEPWHRAEPVFREEPVAPPPPPPAPTVREVVAHDDQAALERQRRMTEQLEELEARRQEARRAARVLRDSQTSAPSHSEVWSTARSATAGVVGGQALAIELRDPKALRRAMILREVLDPPKALR